MAGQRTEVITKRSFDFGDLVAGQEQTVTLRQSIEGSMFGTGTLAVRVHSLAVGSGSGGTIRVNVRIDGKTPFDPSLSFVGPVLGSVVVAASGLSAPRLEVSTFAVRGAMVLIEVVGAQDATSADELDAALSIELLLQTDVYRPDLLDFAMGTFVRATSAAFVDPRPTAAGGTGAQAWGFVGGSLAANWKGDDVTRIFADGAVLIEGARTNDITDNRVGATGWSATRTNDAGTSPDGDTVAHRVTAISPTNNVVNVHKFYDPGFVSRAASIYAKAGTQGSYVDIDHGTVGSDDPRSPQPSDWARLILNQTTRFLSYGPSRGDLNPNVDVGDNALFDLAQAEVGEFPSSPIRTSGTATTRNQDELVVAQADIDGRLFTDGFELDFWPEYDSGTSGHTHTAALLNVGADATLNRLLSAAQGASTDRVSFRSTTTTDYDNAADITFSAGDKITFRVLHASLITISIDDVAVTTVDISGAAPWPVADCAVGQLGDDTLPAFGVISRPRAT